MSNAIALNRRGFLRINDGPGTAIHVWSGALWVTQEGDARDHYLSAGESFIIDRRGTAIATAMRRASVSVTPPAPSPRGFSLLQFFFAKAVAW
jgi:DUF2917 family protein